MAVKEINITVATQIPILIKILSQCSSILRLAEGTMFVYKDVWIFIIVDDSLTCEREHNENDKNSVAII